MAPPDSAQPNDPELVHRARRGDHNAFHDLVDRHSPWIYRLAVSMVTSREDAEDLVQETFLAASRGLATFEHRSSVQTWLRRILLNHVSKLYRSRKLRRHLSLDDANSAAVDPGNQPGLQTGSPAGAVEGKLDVEAMLDTLSPEHREVIVLREIEGLAYEEIAALLKVPRGTVESRLHRARQQLKDKFAGYLQDRPAEEDDVTSSHTGRKRP